MYARQVEGELFQVHGHIFQRESDESRRLVSRRHNRSDGIVILDDISKVEFESFLTAVYCKYVIALSLALNFG
jgi:hypothetical protein